ncbi:MAG: hypothetical protein L6R42_003126 [Xanthoria sp. 1 TBL-2021]|nr:MAG: hypothetical protein L6R42_003126 [Xanthoria sp. 1 TBL-2021]
MKLAVLPLLLALTLHATPRLAQPISPGSSVRQIPTSDIIVVPKANVQSPSEISSTDTLLSDVPFDVTRFNGDTYPIKGTDLVLTITFGAKLDGPSLASFLLVTHDVVAERIKSFGGAMGFPTNSFEWDQGGDLEFVAKSSHELGRGLTWAMTREVIEGLQDFLVGAKRFQESSCRVNLATGGKNILGYVDVRRKKETRQPNLVRGLPVPLLMNGKNITVPLPVRMNPNVHVDIHPSFFSRLDIVAVINILAVTKDWALENIQRVGPNRPIDHGELWKTLAEGVQIKMSAAPPMSLTYGLVVDTVDRLLMWELDQHKKKGTARAVQFGILEFGVVKGAGSIKKDNRRRLDVTR